MRHRFRRQRGRPRACFPWGALSWSVLWLSLAWFGPPCLGSPRQTPSELAPSGSQEAASWAADGHPDGAALERALAEVKAPAEASEGGIGSYLRFLVRETLDSLFGALGRSLSYLPISGAGLLLAARLLAFLALGFLLWQLGRLLLRRLQRSEDEEQGAAARDLQPIHPAGTASVDDWRQRWRKALDEGELEAALEALWWWLALRLAGEQVDSSWSTGQLLASARRRDLAPLARRFDGYQYGPRRPSAEEILDLAGHLERSTA